MTNSCWPPGWRPELAEVGPAREDLGMVSVPGWRPAGLRRARKASRLTQADLAARLKVSRELVGRWETTGAPRADRVAQLLDVLGVELSDLVDHDNAFTERRLRAGLSQQRLAELAGVPRSTVQALEAGAVPSSSAAARAVETALSASPAGTAHRAADIANSGQPQRKSRPAGNRSVPTQTPSTAAVGVRWRPGALREARKAAGLSQAGLAAELGVTREAVGRWEAGSTPRLEHISQVAQALGLDATTLVEGPGEERSSLAALRVQAGLSQRRLAELTGVPRSSIQAVERGVFQPSDAVVAAYAEACEVPVATVRDVVTNSG